MNDQRRGSDPTPPDRKPDIAGKPGQSRQQGGGRSADKPRDAANDEGRVDGGRAIDVDDLNSANDE